MSEPEAERYELLAAPLWRFEPTRRELLGRLGAGVLFAFTAPAPAAPPGGALTTRFHIGQEGQITLLTGKVELGQGARTLLLRAAAEELGRKPEELKILMGDTSLVPDDGGTWASLTTPQTVPAVRHAAAALRSVLEGRQAPDAGWLTEPGRWQVLGKPGGQTTAVAAVTGGLRFTADLPAQDRQRRRNRRRNHWRDWRLDRWGNRWRNRRRPAAARRLAAFDGGGRKHPRRGPLATTSGRGEGSRRLAGVQRVHGSGHGWRRRGFRRRASDVPRLRSRRRWAAAHARHENETLALRAENPLAGEFLVHLDGMAVATDETNAHDRSAPKRLPTARARNSSCRSGPADPCGRPRAGGNSPSAERLRADRHPPDRLWFQSEPVWRGGQAWAAPGGEPEPANRPIAAAERAAKSPPANSP